MTKLLTHDQKKILNCYQRDFPLTPRPFAEMGKELGLEEDEVIAEITNLSNQKIISRLGATVSPNRAGASTLVAMAIPHERLDEIAQIVSAQSEVNHNYERDHQFNLWFVLTTTDDQKLQAALARIEDLTGFPLLNLPLEKPYHIDLGFTI